MTNNRDDIHIVCVTAAVICFLLGVVTFLGLVIVVALDFL